MMRKQTQAAFTLIELVFVIVLISLITTVAIPKITSTMGLNSRSGVLRVAGFLETAYQQAVLTHQTIRMNFDLDKRRYWADTVNEAQTISLIDATTKLDEVLDTFRKRAENDESDEEKQKREDQKFSKIDREGLKPTSVSSGLKIASVSFPGREQTITQGVASFYISASGLNDEVVISLAHGDDTPFLIIFPPITGKARIDRGEYEPKK